MQGLMRLFILAFHLIWVMLYGCFVQYSNKTDIYNYIGLVSTCTGFTVHVSEFKRIDTYSSCMWSSLLSIHVLIFMYNTTHQIAWKDLFFFCQQWIGRKKPFLALPHWLQRQDCMRYSYPQYTDHDCTLLGNHSSVMVYKALHDYTYPVIMLASCMHAVLHVPVTTCHISATFSTKFNQTHYIQLQN